MERKLAQAMLDLLKAERKAEFNRNCKPKGIDQAIRDAATVREIGQMYEPGSDVSWQFALEVTAGLALHTARASRLDVQPMVLWDGLPGAGEGGIASFVQFWRHELKQEPIIVRMPEAPDPVTYCRPLKNRSERATLHQEVKSMLFADIVGYSKLTESNS